MPHPASSLAPVRRRVSAAALTLALAACLPGPVDAPDVPTPDAGPAATLRQPDLVVDADRDGRLDLAGDSDEPGEETFAATAGAVVLANLDDDDADGRVDARDDTVTDDRDIPDLSPLAVRGVSTVPDGATATLSIARDAAPHARLFRVVGEATRAASYVLQRDGTASLDAADLRAGASFAVEARAFVSHPRRARRLGPRARRRRRSEPCWTRTGPARPAR